MEGRSWWRVLIEHFDLVGVLVAVAFILGFSL
jgi:hypothetical protein